MSHAVLKTTLTPTDFAQSFLAFQADHPAFESLWLGSRSQILIHVLEDQNAFFLMATFAADHQLKLSLHPSAELPDLTPAHKAMGSILRWLLEHTLDTQLLNHTLGAHALLS